MKSPPEARSGADFDSERLQASPHALENSRLPLTENSAAWSFVPKLFRSSQERLPAPWEDRFGPLRAGSVDELVVVGQIGQSIDGRIATATGHSKYINGPAGLAHLHRLRALVDAVVVGVRTAIADDPLLTVRNVVGPNPARVVLDPSGRLPPNARLLADDGTRRIVMTGEGVAPKLHPDIEILNLRSSSEGIAPTTILYALADCGFRRILIEGGANTVSRFIAAGCLDRLHVVVAPIIIGAGQSGVTLAPIDHVGEALRSPIRAHILGEEVLFDCDLTAQRVAIGRAKKST